MAVEEWERRRACVVGLGDLRVDPNWFAPDARREQLELAEVACSRCPVRTECRDQVMQAIRAGKPVNGFYAGQKWTSRPSRRGPAEERRCAASACPTLFVVTGANTNKRYCSEACSARELVRRRQSKAKAS
jgi:Transcription factor WhiB/CGNR zinc finger